MDLLWTTLSEFPGEGPAPGGAGTVQPGNVAVTSCQLEANPISKKSRGFVSNRSYKLSRMVKGLTFYCMRHRKQR